MLKIAPALALPFLSLAAADDGAAVLGVAAGARNGVVAGTTSGLLSAEAERRMEENGGLQAAGLIRGVGQGMDGGADVHEEWD